MHYLYSWLWLAWLPSVVKWQHRPAFLLKPREHNVTFKDLHSCITCVPAQCTICTPGCGWRGFQVWPGCVTGTAYLMEPCPKRHSTTWWLGCATRTACPLVTGVNCTARRGTAPHLAVAGAASRWPECTTAVARAVRSGSRKGGSGGVWFWLLYEWPPCDSELVWGSPTDGAWRLRVGWVGTGVWVWGAVGGE
eukprot:1160883-Pelagomonas_calceolata.AAC.9